MSVETGWRAEHVSGRAAAFHARELPTPWSRALWWFDVEAPALVLGSAQPDAHVDRPACERAGVEVVRRRSGGGAVLLLPGEVCWLDVLLPRHDDRWLDDVGRAAWWLGEVWAEALDALGVRVGGVHRGPMQRTAWSQHVCFAGTGPGEVLDPAGAKLVGISQRRTRDGARFQCALHLAWRPDRYAELLQEGPTASELAPVAAWVGRDLAEVRTTFERVLRAGGAVR